MLTLSGVDDQFVVDDGTHTLLSVNRTSGATYLRGQLAIGHDPKRPVFLTAIDGDTQMQGDLTVGGSLVPGVRTATIQSPDGAASLHVLSGNRSNAFVEIEAPTDYEASLDLWEGDNLFSIANIGVEDKLVIHDGQERLLTITRDTGETDLRGELRVGHDWANPVFAVRDVGNTGYTVMRGDLTVGGANTTGGWIG